MGVRVSISILQDFRRHGLGPGGADVATRIQALESSTPFQVVSRVYGSLNDITIPKIKGIGVRTGFLRHRSEIRLAVNYLPDAIWKQ